MNNPKKFPASHPQQNRWPNNASDDDLTIPEADHNPAMTVRAQVFLNFMELQDPPLLYECFVCQIRHPSERALSGHMKRHPERPWRGLCPPHTPNASGRSILPPFFWVPGFCPPPSAESSLLSVARGRVTDAIKTCTPLKFDLNKFPDDEENKM